MSANYETEQSFAPHVDEQCIQRIARAMCRAARINPDQPAAAVASFTIMRCHSGTSSDDPAWTLFRRQAELFVSTHPDMADAL